MQFRDRAANGAANPITGDTAASKYGSDYLDANGQSVAEVVADWQRHLAHGWLPLPHPSPRNRLWLRRHPWFEREVVPALRRAVATALAP